MHVLIGIALKSLLIAGLTLGLLAADEAAVRPPSARGSPTSACSRWSCMAVAPLALPSWNVEAPALARQRAERRSAGPDGLRRYIGRRRSAPIGVDRSCRTSTPTAAALSSQRRAATATTAVLTRFRLRSCSSSPSLRLPA